MVDDTNSTSRITLNQIEAFIDEEIYTHIEDTTLTLCILKMRNDVIFVGEATCASAENYNQELCRRIAKQRAIEQCWKPFGFHRACILTGENP